MRIVADTNIFLAVTFDEPEGERLLKLTTGHQLVAPEVLPFEIANALTAMMKKGVLNSKELREAWDIITTVPVDLRAINIGSALTIANQFNIHAYDAYFLECALNLRLPILTLDGQMKRVARELTIEILE